MTNLERDYYSHFEDKETKTSKHYIIAQGPAGETRVSTQRPHCRSPQQSSLALLLILASSSASDQMTQEHCFGDGGSCQGEWAEDEDTDGEDLV